MTPMLIDTGPIVALLDRSDEWHGECSKLISELDAPLVTCEAVVAEACYLLRDVSGAPSAVLENVDKGNFLVPYRLSGRAAKLAKLLRKYADQPMDFADACLVDLADELGTGRILTLDSDFNVFRWGRNRAFDLMIDL